MDPNANAKPCGEQAFPDIGELTITVKGVEALLKKLNPSKATGPDEIPSTPAGAHLGTRPSSNSALPLILLVITQANSQLRGGQHG